MARDTPRPLRYATDYTHITTAVLRLAQKFEKSASFATKGVSGESARDLLISMIVRLAAGKVEVDICSISFIIIKSKYLLIEIK